MKDLGRRSLGVRGNNAKRTRRAKNKKGQREESKFGGNRRGAGGRGLR